jgi:hypothetical protein
MTDRPEAPIAGEPTATFCISRSESFEAPHKPGSFCTYYPRGQKETILSIQPDGSKGVRFVNEAAAWETWTPSKDGNRAVFAECVEYYAIPLVD